MKKIKFILVVVLFLATTVVTSAQLIVNESGRVSIGTEINEIGATSNVGGTPTPVIWPLDTCAMMSVYGEYNTRHGGGVINFGDNLILRRLVGIGELGITDTDQLWLFGRKGMYLTTLSNDTVCYYDTNKGDFFQFNCDVKTTGVFVSSDSRYKKDIEPIDNASDGLALLSPVSYRLMMEQPEVMMTASLEETKGRSPKDIETEEIRRHFAEARANAPVRFGFLAQEVKEVYPELVKTDSLGYMYIDYIGFIPLLVNAVNELRVQTIIQAETIETLESMLVEGEATQMLAPKISSAASTNIEDVIIPKLYQNQPNPFMAQTEILFDLPTSVLQAAIYIYDLQGHQIKKIDVLDRCKSSVTIESSELQPGMYIYSLIADGKEIDSKRMILTD